MPAHRSTDARIAWARQQRTDAARPWRSTLPAPTQPLLELRERLAADSMLPPQRALPGMARLPLGVRLRMALRVLLGR